MTFSHDRSDNTPSARRRTRRGVAALAAAGLLLTGAACSDDEGDEAVPDAEATAGDDDAGSGDEANDGETFSGTLAAPEEADGAFAYAEGAPDGAELSVTIAGEDDGTTFELDVTGLEPDRGYAVHAHVDPCGPTGDDAGPHYQDEVDPAATPDEPSVDPAYANPDNEVWLDVMTDAEGSGTATAEVPFTFDEGGAPASIIVHEAMETATEEGEAGTAGDRLACLDTPLG